jgi:hypothetical protein
MNTKHSQWCWLAVLVMASIGALGQNPPPMRVAGALDAAGPWTIRGIWSVTIKPSGKADFSAAVNMEHSDFYLLANHLDDNPTNLGPHTHHITLVDADISPITGGFEVTGTATITVNGSPAPVSPSPITVDVTGGTSLQYSNVSLVFGNPGSKHFGTDPITGVVQTVVLTHN